MKRLTPAQLEAKSEESGIPFEVDPETNTAYLKVGRNEWYARSERRKADAIDGGAA